MKKIISAVAAFILGCAGEAFAQSALEKVPCHSHSPKLAGTQSGLFTVHTKCDHVLYEIPPRMLGRAMLINTEFAALAASDEPSVAPGLVADARVVRWVRRGDQVHLELVQYEMRASAESGLERALEQGSAGFLVRSFEILGEGPEGAPIIDVTSLVTSSVPQGFAQEFRRQFHMVDVDPKRSYVESVKVFPQNIEVHFFQTWIPDPKDLIKEPQPGEKPIPAGMAFLFHASMLLLPEQPMQGRYADDRVGYFPEAFEDYGTRRPGAVRRAFIQRYRLEKKDPSAEVSEPVKPIVFYLSREVPDRWRPYIKRGIEDWQVVFQKAGFLKAIVARDAPSEAEDPNWDPEDARYSVIRWVPGNRQTAMGPGLADPRSGEVISSHAIFWHNVLKRLENWYFTQVAPLDARAQHLPLSDQVLGELLRGTVVHEVGHALGLRHNFKAHAAYSVAQLRSRQWTQRWGTSASVMSYARYNYVAQPGDDAYLLPKFGPYDYFALEWGYRPFPGLSADEEWKELDAMAARQVEDPMLRFGGEDEVADVDPTVMTDVLGADPIEAADLGLHNVDRVAGMLVEAATERGRDYTRLSELYDALVTLRHRELFAVAKLVGGVVETRNQARRGAAPFEPVPPQRQHAAIKFLLARGFVTPSALLEPDILKRIGPGVGADALHGADLKLLTRLLDPAVFQRVAEANAPLPRAQRYTTTELMLDLNHGLFSELNQPNPVVELYRRDLQRSYVRLLVDLASGKEPPAPRVPATLEYLDWEGALEARHAVAVRGRNPSSALAPAAEQQQRRDKSGPSELSAALSVGIEDLQKMLTAARKRVEDDETAAHLRDLLLALERAR